MFVGFKYLCVFMIFYYYCIDNQLYSDRIIQLFVVIYRVFFGLVLGGRDVIFYYFFFIDGLIFDNDVSNQQFGVCWINRYYFVFFFIQGINLFFF